MGPPSFFGVPGRSLFFFSFFFSSLAQGQELGQRSRHNRESLRSRCVLVEGERKMEGLMQRLKVVLDKITTARARLVTASKVRGVRWGMVARRQ